MSRQLISQLGERETIDQVFLASDKQLRPNRNGNLYLQLRLSDRSGSVNSMMWNANNNVYGAFDNGDYIHVEGTTQFYNGKLQIIASDIRRVDAGEVDEADFVQKSEHDLGKLTARLAEILRSLQNTHLSNLAECFLIDDTFMGRFCEAPAGIKNHHAYRGGLLEHTVNMMEVALAIAPRYPEIDRDLLTMGVFLHDAGKIDELAFDRELAYTDEGQLIGHNVLILAKLDEKIRQAEELSGEPFAKETALRLKHMIVSHHGQYEFGSPKLPMTLEAVALHCLDHLDSKIHGFAQLMREDANADSRWTPYFPNIGRKLFKSDLP